MTTYIKRIMSDKSRQIGKPNLPFLNRQRKRLIQHTAQEYPAFFLVHPRPRRSAQQQLVNRKIKKDIRSRQPKGINLLVPADYFLQHALFQIFIP